MVNKYEPQKRYRSNSNQRKQTQSSNNFRNVLIVVSSVLLVSTIVLSFTLFKENQNRDIDSNEAIKAPIATPQLNDDNEIEEMSILIQDTINQAIAGELSSQVRLSLEKQGISSESLDLLETTLVMPQEESPYIDGSFLGVGDGHNGPITVKVTINDGEILFISVIEHEETSPALNEVFHSIPINILKDQSTQYVDAISGATQVSDGLISAVESALLEAKKR